jgi:hypothetical protein
VLTAGALSAQSADADIVPILACARGAAKTKPFPRTKAVNSLVACNCYPSAILPQGNAASGDEGASLENECYPLVALRRRGHPR